MIRRVITALLSTLVVLCWLCLAIITCGFIVACIYKAGWMMIAFALITLQCTIDMGKSLYKHVFKGEKT